MVEVKTNLKHKLYTSVRDCEECNKDVCDAEIERVSRQFWDFEGVERC